MRARRVAAVVVAVAAIGSVISLLVVTLAALLPDGGPSSEPVDMEKLRHDVAVRCGISDDRLVDPDLWDGGASWRVAGTMRRSGISFGGEGVYCGE
jgi:hypothetical protein